VSRVMGSYVSVPLRESGQFPTRVKEVLTLLVKSWRSIFNAIKGRVAKGIYSIFLTSRRHMQARVSARL
jgi:hypothetical protein